MSIEYNEYNAKFLLIQEHLNINSDVEVDQKFQSENSASIYYIFLNCD